jgi:type 1 glutamine amidotransferase
MKKILLVSDGIVHPPLFGRMALHKALKQLGGFSFVQVPSLEKAPPDLNPFSAMVLHYHHKTISGVALGRLDGFVKNGGGILAIHAATASFKESLPYFDILGGRFIDHGKVERFEVVNQKSDVFSGIPNFIVKDELYIHELNDKILVHFTTKHEGRNVPVVWTYQYGNGKVCYAVPGHTTGSMNNEIYQQVLARGLKWVAE